MIRLGMSVCSVRGGALVPALARSRGPPLRIRRQRGASRMQAPCGAASLCSLIGCPPGRHGRRCKCVGRRAPERWASCRLISLDEHC